MRGVPLVGSEVCSRPKWTPWQESPGSPRGFPVEQGQGFQVVNCPPGGPATQEREPDLGTRGQSRTPG